MSRGKSKRLVLRPMEARDFDSWVEFRQAMADKKVSRADFRKALAREKRQAANEVRWEWKIFEKKSGRMLGFIDIKTITRGPHQICDVGYVVTPLMRGQGIATEAALLAIPMIFKKLKFHRLEFVIDLDNKSSIRVAKKAGLIRECVRKHYWPANYPKPGGKWVDQLIYFTTPELF